MCPKMSSVQLFTCVCAQSFTFKHKDVHGTIVYVCAQDVHGTIAYKHKDVHATIVYKHKDVHGTIVYMQASCNQGIIR
jgi:hypothetical protein